MSKFLRHVLIFAVTFILTSTAFYAVGKAVQVERPAAHKTKQWLIRGETDNRNITVIDTTGVCLYVVSGYRETAIAAVSKKALPEGAGCQ